DDVAVEGVRALPVGDVDHAVVELHWQRHSRHPLSRSRRPFSRSQLRFFSVSRLSWSFLPRPSAISTLARPFSLKNIFSGTIVMPARSRAGAGLSIGRGGRKSLRGRLGVWLKGLAGRYWGMWALTSHISPFLASA